MNGYFKYRFTEKIDFNVNDFIQAMKDAIQKEASKGSKSIEELETEQKAKEKIENTSKTLTEISEEQGFESIHYFTRFFKKMTGVSPKEYRNITSKK